MLDSRIDDLLVACLNEAPPPDLSRRLTACSDGDWDQLVGLANWHRVAPLFFKRVKCAITESAIPAGAAQRLRDIHQRTAIANMLRLRELARLLRELRTRGIDVLVLKGAHLATAVYGDPALRDMRDIDILVGQHDLSDAYRALVELGNADRQPRDLEQEIKAARAKHHHVPPVTVGSAGPVEMHWRITLPGEPVAIEMEDIWRRSREIRIAGERAMALAPEDLLLHLSLHAALQHRFRMRLRHLCDFAMVLTHHRDDIDWDRLTAVANATGASRFVYCSLRVAECVLGAPLPHAGVERLIRSAADEAIIPIVRDYFLAASLELPVAYRAARAAPGFSQKARIILGGIAPSPARLRRMYGLAPSARLVYLYYPVRIADLIARRGRVLVEMMTSSARFSLTLRHDDAARQIDRWVDQERTATA